jgi:DNA-binding beta-propeller fold protein YncE
MISNRAVVAILLSIAVSSSGTAGCAGTAGRPSTSAETSGGETPQAAYRDVGKLPLGEPLALSVDFSGNMYIADGAPGRIVCWRAMGSGSLEFQRPNQQPGFYPSDIDLSAFFVYAIDPVERTLLRFDNRGAYRDILIKFDEVSAGRRITPMGLDVDSYGRVAVSDVGNHQVLVFDTNLAVELAFGSYGSHAGQFDNPQGIAFAPDGGMIVADTGNKRLQWFDRGGKFSSILPREGDNPLIMPRRAAVDRDGTVYVADPGANKVFVFGADGLLIRSITPAGVSDFHPMDVDVDASGAIYVTDAANASVFVFR